MHATILVSWAVCGLIVGLIAQFVVRGRRRIGLFRTIVLGVLGALAGGLIDWAFQGDPAIASSLADDAWRGWIVSMLGAAVVLWIYPNLQPKRWWQ